MVCPAIKKIALSLGLTLFSLSGFAEGSSAGPWNGFHMGVNTGAVITKQSYTTSPQGALVTSPFLGSRDWGRNYTNESNGEFAGGLQFGYNWTFAERYVLGLEADFQLSEQSNTQTTSFSPQGGPTTVVRNTTSTEVSSLSTLRGRFGYLVDPKVLIYGSAGVAYGKVKESFVSSVTSNLTLVEVFPIDFSKSAFGYVLGVGGEWAFAPQWSVRAEYQLISLGTKQSHSTPTTYFGPGALSLDVMKVSTGDHRIDFLHVGINYSF